MIVQQTTKNITTIDTGVFVPGLNNTVMLLTAQLLGVFTLMRMNHGLTGLEQSFQALTGLSV